MIVLGGDQVETGSIGRSTFWRTFYASHLWKGSSFARIIVSGAGAPPIADQMRSLLVLSGVPANTIEVEGRSRTTRENAVEVAAMQWAKTDKPVLISSDFHMRRATASFRRAGLAVTPCPAPDGIKQYLRIASRWSLAMELAGETIKLTYYWFRGWV